MAVFAGATGLGSWPGRSARTAAEIVVGELADLPHLVELPDRGVGADMIGRAGALLVDIALDTTVRGYRMGAGSGAVTRRAASLLGEDLDALEEAWENAGLRGAAHPVKVQAPGPVTLAAELELRNGHRALTDPGAVRELGASLAEGVGAAVRELARRLDSAVVVQFDEPALPAALGGRVPGVTALSPVAPLDPEVALRVLTGCIEAVGVATALHCCAPGVPWALLQRSGVDAVAVDPAVLGPADLDGLGAMLDSGRTIQLGVVPAQAPADPPGVTELAAVAAGLIDRIGFGRMVLADRVGITPACGLAGATADWARRALTLAVRTAAALADDPESVAGDSLHR
ncbi:methionine synthase [Mycobacterium koreense]|uniref:Methionine synthase n=1 Tax=Mycolicibacillus koreensis TaxID=1069220 RepID=A0A7I7SCV2_9MYCO|nr:methionine synthase [Mycolicibacillus koreensis]MCV7249029.1 methionine synthase [Mycolicibacillus koreensis]OSC34083.1 methionine synthase [Mycolicibacillus koreensis]BBY54543.1 hypothetical protein MKOR_17940 [Mycolicibacillus koreensis]